MTGPESRRRQLVGWLAGSVGRSGGLDTQQGEVNYWNFNYFDPSCIVALCQPSQCHDRRRTKASAAFS